MWLRLDLFGVPFLYGIYRLCYPVKLYYQERAGKYERAPSTDQYSSPETRPTVLRCGEINTGLRVVILPPREDGILVATNTWPTFGNELG